MPRRRLSILSPEFTAGPAAFSYDTNGNLTDGSVTYSYDTGNRLTGASGARTASLLYDPPKKTLRRLVRVHDGNTANARWFVHDGDALVAEFDGAGTMLKRYLHGPGVDEPLAWFDGSGTTAANRHDMFANAQGSIIAITNGSGATETINRYDEFGIPQPGNAGRFGFTGQAWIPELGLSYYKARMYSPSLGRFMQTDPIGYDDGPNWYNYVGGDPVNRTDPTGQCGTWNDWVETGLILCSNKQKDPSGGGGGGGGGAAKGTGPQKRRDTGGGGNGKPTDPDIVATAIEPRNRAACQSSQGRTTSGAADYLGDVAEYSDYAAFTLGGAAIFASPTGFGGVALGGAALGAKFVSVSASALKFGMQLADGDRVGAGATAISAAAGLVPAGLGRAVLKGTNVTGRNAKAVDILAGAQGAAVGITVEGILCGLGS